MFPQLKQELISQASILTPIEEYDGVLYKRDDLFSPFEYIPINGGKLRQCITLIDKLEDRIRDDFNGKVATACGLHSPQGLIVTSVAKVFGFNAMVAYANSKSIDHLLEKNPIIRRIDELGGEVKIIAKLGFESNMQKKLKQIILEGKDIFFVVKFGINLEEHSDAIIDSISCQVKNIPNDLDNLVVPVGSGITAAGIIKGLIQYEKQPKNLYLIQIAGYDRTDTIDRIVPLWRLYCDFEFISYKEFPYSKRVVQKITEDFELDQIYESKAYRWMQGRDLEGKTLFWVVGNGNKARE